MFGRGLAAAVVGLLVSGSAARAHDTIRLGGAGEATISRLGFDGNADTLLVHGRGHGGHHGHFRGGHHGHFHGGHHGHFHGGHHGHFRGHHGHFHGSAHYRPYYNHSYHYHHYRPYAYRSYYPYYDYAYYPRFYSYPYSSYRPYAYPSYSYYHGGYFFPCGLAGDSAYVGPALGPGDSTRVPAMPPANGAQTYPYDGGPRSPVPQPGDQEPRQPPRPAAPAAARFVSLPLVPGDVTSLTFAAYGEPSARPMRWVVARRALEESPVAAASPFAYPAYGEQPRSSSFATDR